MRYLGGGYVRFSVYSPHLDKPWSATGAIWWRAPWVFLVRLARGLLFIIRRPALGRAVTLEDMLSAHPGKPSRCVCYGHGIVFSYRDGEREGQFCAAMLGAFRRRVRGRVAATSYGPRWLAAYEPQLPG